MESRCIVTVAERRMEVRTLPVPDDLPAGHALLEVEGVGICGSDYDLYTGALGRMRPVPYPLVPGHEVVGRLLSDGDGALLCGARTGDRVAVEPVIRCGVCPECNAGLDNNCRNAMVYAMRPLADAPGLWGGMSQYMCIHPRTVLHPLPDDIPVEDCVLFNPLANAYDWVCRVGGAGVGSSVLVLGSGQRGLSCVVAAREAGAERIIVTGLHRDAAKLQLAMELGATDTIDVEAEDVVARVRAITGGEMVDRALDVVPEAGQPLIDAIEALRPGGTLVVAGVKGRPIDGVPTDRIMAKSLTLRGVRGISSWAVREAVRVIASRRFPLGRLHSHVLGLDDAERAVRMLGGEIPGETPVHITIRPQLSRR